MCSKQDKHCAKRTAEKRFFKQLAWNLSIFLKSQGQVVTSRS